MAFVFVPLSVLALSNLTNAQRGNATGLFNLTRELGGSIGTAWMGTMLNRLSVKNSSYLAENINPMSADAMNQLQMMARGTFGGLADGPSTALMMMSARVHQQGLIKAFGQSFTIVAVLLFFSISAVLLMQAPKSNVKIEGAH